MKTKLLIFYFTIFYICSTFAQQPPSPGTEDTNPGNLEGSDMPIDKYLGILLVVGIIYMFLITRANVLKKM